MVETMIQHEVKAVSICQPYPSCKCFLQTTHDSHSGYYYYFNLNATLNIAAFHLVKISLHVLSFLLASLDSLLRDATHWFPANAHSSVYDNPFNPSCRCCIPSHPSLSLPFIATEPFNVHLMHVIYFKNSR